MSMTDADIPAADDAGETTSFAGVFRKTLPTTISLLVALAIPAISFFLPFGTFDAITDLPAHPLVVHAVVVFAPISVVLLLGAVFVQAWRLPLQWAAIGSLVTASLITLGVTAVWMWWSRMGLPQALARILAGLVVASAVAMSGVTYAAGHSVLRLHGPEPSRRQERRSPRRRSVSVRFRSRKSLNTLPRATVGPLSMEWCTTSPTSSPGTLLVRRRS